MGLDKNKTGKTFDVAWISELVPWGRHLGPLVNWGRDSEIGDGEVMVG